MTLEKLNLQITTPEDDDNTDPEFIRLRESLMAIKQPLLDAIANKDLPKAEELHKQALEAKAKLEAYKESLKKSEKGKFTYERYLSDLHPFMIETYKKWSYTEEQLKVVESVTSNPDNIHIDQEIPFDTLIENNKDNTKRELNKAKAGEIYLSSDISNFKKNIKYTQKAGVISFPEETIDYKNAKSVLVKKPEDIKARSVGDVLKYIHEKYKNDKNYIIADIKYYIYLIELSDKYNQETDGVKKAELLKLIPEQIRIQSSCFFPKSVFVDQDGYWLCPYIVWMGSHFGRGASRLEEDMDSDSLCVLFER